MRMKSRILAMVLAAVQIAVLMPLFGSVAYADEPDKAEVLFKYTGDAADDSAWKVQKGEYELTTLEGRAGKVLKLGKSESYFAVDNETQITKGNVVLSYDFMAETDSGYAYIILAQNEVQSVLPIPWTTSGRFGALVYNGAYLGIPDVSPNSRTSRTYESTVEAEIWQHVDLWLNFDTRMITLYVDGRKIATEEMHPQYLKFYSFGFVSDRDMNVFNLDNMYVGYVPTGAEYDFEFLQGTSPEVATGCYAETKYEPLGHIYTDSNIKVTAELENVKAVPNEIMYEYRATTDDGHVAYTEQNTIKLEPNEKKSVDIEFKVSEYGFYNDVFTITDPKSGKKSEIPSRFSYIKTRSDGAKSRITGNNSHYQANRGTAEVDRIQKLFADMGIAEMREGAPWAQYESTVGTYALTGYHRAFLNAFKENNQNVHFILGHENLARNIPFPKTDAELAAWAAYVEKIVQDVAPYGVRDFEVWNEVDLKWGAGACTAEEYVKLLKVTYPIVHKYVPNARVFAFSCARNYSNFIGECLAFEGCENYFDGISYHPYDVATRPEVDNFHPTENSFHEYIAEIDDIVEKYGLQDKALVISEFGYTSSDRYMTEDDMANWTVRASCLAYDHVEYINWFMNVEKIDNRATNDAEYHFGWLRAWKNAEILYEAKPVIATVAQYNSMITSRAESLGNQEILDGKGRLYRYRDDGRDVYMAWTIQGEEDFAIDLGAPEATIYDRFGNSHKQKTENGILYINLSEKPQYITGNFTKYEEVEGGGFRISGSALEAVMGDILGIKLYKTIGNDSDYSVDVALPLGAELVDNKGFVNGICNVGVLINKEFVSGSTTKISVKNKDGNVVWFREMPMNIIDAAETEFSIEYNKSGRWIGELKITNTSNRNISGNLNILYPEELAAKIPSVKIDTVIPKMTRLVTFNLPVDATRDYIEFKGEVVLDNGSTIEVAESSYFTGLTRIPSTPTIDGVIEKNEYNGSLPIVLDKERMVQGIAGARETFQWEGLKDLSGRGYINYDEKYFYLAMEIEDDIMGSNDEKKRIWANDSIQFSFAERREKDSGYTEIGIGIVDNEPAIARYYYMGEKENIIFHDAIGKKDGFEEDTELMISRNGTKTTYELKLPWVDIYPTREPFNMENVFFSIIINENDLNGREGWLEFSPGIGYVKNPADFTSIIVMK